MGFDFGIIYLVNDEGVIYYFVFDVYRAQYVHMNVTELAVFDPNYNNPTNYYKCKWHLIFYHEALDIWVFFTIFVPLLKVPVTTCYCQTHRPLNVALITVLQKL